MKHYLIGGSVRDFLLNRSNLNSDKDYVVEGCESFADLRNYVMNLGYVPVQNSGTESGFVEFPETLTLKARNPETNEVEDFACCRSEFDYKDRRHPEKCELGTLEQDVNRRDLTINALLIDPETNEVIDLVNGQLDLNNRILRTVGRACERFEENPIRMLRVLRFACELDFAISYEIKDCFESNLLLNYLAQEPDDCKVKELNKILKNKSNYGKFFDLISILPKLREAIFSNIGLMATNKKEFV